MMFSEMTNICFIAMATNNITPVSLCRWNLLTSFVLFVLFKVENSENLLQMQTVFRPAEKRGGRCTHTYVQDSHWNNRTYIMQCNIWIICKIENLELQAALKRPAHFCACWDSWYCLPVLIGVCRVFFKNVAIRCHSDCHDMLHMEVGERVSYYGYILYFCPSETFLICNNRFIA